MGYRPSCVKRHRHHHPHHQQQQNCEIDKNRDRRRQQQKSLNFITSLIIINLLLIFNSVISHEVSIRQTSPPPLPPSPIMLSTKTTNSKMSSGPTLSRQTVPRKDAYVASMLSPNENKIVTNRKELILENENENKNVHNEILGIDDGQWKKLNQNAHVFTNQFVIESKYDPDHIKILAQQHGFDYLGHVSFDLFFWLKKLLS